MIKEQIKAVTTAVTTNVVNPMQNFYKENSSTINATGAITFSLLSTATAIKNSEEIIHTIRDRRNIYTQSIFLDVSSEKYTQPEPQRISFPGGWREAQ